MAHAKFTKDVQSEILSELEGFMQQTILYTSDNIRSVCEKVGISHTTFYRQMQRYRTLEKSNKPITQQETDLVAFGQRVETLLTQLQFKRQSSNIWSLLKTMGNIVNQHAKEEADFEKSVAKQNRNAENNKMRKQQKKITDTEQRTEQLTKGMRAYQFKTEKSLKNM